MIDNIYMAINRSNYQNKKNEAHYRVQVCINSLLLIAGAEDWWHLYGHNQIKKLESHKTRPSVGSQARINSLAPIEGPKIKKFLVRNSNHWKVHGGNLLLFLAENEHENNPQSLVASS